jgi:hypothetical protein
VLSEQVAPVYSLTSQNRFPHANSSAVAARNPTNHPIGQRPPPPARGAIGSSTSGPSLPTGHFVAALFPSDRGRRGRKQAHSGQVSTARLENRANADRVRIAKLEKMQAKPAQERRIQSRGSCGNIHLIHPSKTESCLHFLPRFLAWHLGGDVPSDLM